MSKASEEYERDIRELAQSVATLEVVLCAIISQRPQTEVSILEKHLKSLADHALFQRDGLEPVMLDRIIKKISRNGNDGPK